MASESNLLKPRHIPVRREWLALHSEDVIDPDRPIIDAHHHLWDKQPEPYLKNEILADAAQGHNIVATVFVEGKCHYRDDGPEALRPLGETEFVIGLTGNEAHGEAASPRIADGIVGFADLTIGEDVGEVLDAHQEIAKGRFKGVRFTSAWHADPEARGSIVVPPPGVLYDRGLRSGLEEVSRRGLVFDAWTYHTQLGDIVDLAYDFPKLQIVLNHAGGPIGIGPYAGRRRDVMQDWLHFMRRLAAFDNICVKLGGFGMLMSGFDFHERRTPPSSGELAEAWGPYMRSVIDVFGSERCMFESNFPVDNGTTSYSVLWNAFKKIAAPRSASEMDSLFFATAQRVYGLKSFEFQKN